MQPQQQATDLTYQQYPKKIIPLTGKWIPAYEGVDLGLNYKELVNMRYTDTHPVGIGGMTKVNSTVLSDTYQKVRSAFHYTKSQPVESHLLVQAYNADLSASQILQNKAAIPNTGAFEKEVLWTDSPGAGRGFFSVAPSETLIYCNGKENLIWGGDEAKIGGFFIANPDSQVIYDYTDKVQNTMDDAQNVATMTTTGGGIDSYAMVVLHGENNPDDSSGKAHNFTISGVTYATANPKFGTYCFSFNGSNQYMYSANHSDFNMAGGVWSVDTWVYFNSFNAISTIWANGTDANNYHRLYVNTSGIVIYNLVAAGTEKSTVQSGIGSVQTGRWHHIELTENGNDYYLFIDGVRVATQNTTDRPATYSNYFSIGAFHNGSAWSAYAPILLDEFRMSVGVARHTQGFTPQASAYSTSSTSTLYVVSPRQLEAIKLYMKTANTSVASVASDYWNGTAYAKSSAPIDYMEYSSDALAQAAYVSSDTSADLLLDYMEYATDTAAQVAFVSSAGGVLTPMDYMEYATDLVARAAYVSNADTYGPDLLPTNGTGMTASSTASGWDIYYSSDNLDSSWLANGLCPQWVQIDFGVGVTKIIRKVTVKPRLNTGTALVKDWELHASTDNFSSSDITLTTGSHANDATVQTVLFPNNTAYRYYRLVITSTWNSSWAPGVNEWELCELSLQAHSESTIKTEGTYALKGVAAISDSLNKALTHNLYCQTTSPIDLTGQNTIRFDLRSTRTGSNIKLSLQQRYLPQDVNTKLLLHMEGTNGAQVFTDATGKSVTVNGNTNTSTGAYKFGSTAAYFDGNGDTLTLPDHEDWNFGAGDFTIDFWVKRGRTGSTEYVWDHSDTGQTQGIGFYFYSTNYPWTYTTVSGGTTRHMTSTIAISDTTTWHHIAFVRYGTWLYLFIDGQLGASRSDMGTAAVDAPGIQWIIGDLNYVTTRYYFQGYIDEFRVTKGRALWTAPFTMPAAAYAPTDLHTKLLLHCDGANGGTTFTDECGKTVTVGGNANTSTVQKKFGTASAYFDGSGDYLSLADSDDFDFGAGNATMEFWFYAISTAGTIMEKGYYTAGQNGNFAMQYNATSLAILTYDGQASLESVTATTSISASTWYHIAFVKSGTAWTIYKDGVNVGSGTITKNIGDNSAVLLICNNINCYIDEVRISKGAARYTANFTPPTRAYNSTAIIETTPAITAADTFEGKTWDISGTANADKNNIDGIVLTVVNADAANTFYLDNLRAGQVPNLESYSEATNKTQGSYALKGVANTSAANQTLTRTISSPINLSGVETLHFDIRASRMGINLSVAIRDSGGTWTSISPNILAANTYQTVNWDISGVANADKDAIDRIRVTVDNASADNTFYIDNFYASGPPISFQAFSEAALKTQGNYALKCVAAQTTSLNKTLTRTIASPIDLTGVSTIGFDIRASRTGSNIKLGIHDSGGVWTELTPNITVAGSFQNVIWDISGVADANKNAIDQVRITVANADAANTFYLDNFGPAGGALFDGTATAGGTKSLGQTGIISFGSTTNTAKPRMYNGLVGYVYRFTFTRIDPATTVYHATVRSPFQPIVDLWDGVDREATAFYVWKNNTFNDYTLNVYKNEYDATDSATYVALNSLAAGTNKLYFASYERLMGINVGLAGGHVNTTANTVATVRYSSDGQSFITVGTIDDGTSGGGISFSKSGTITWNPPPASMEFMSKVSKVTPRYHYEITFSQAFSSDVQLFYMSGIPVQRQLGQFRFPLMAQDMLFLCCDMSGKKNVAIHSEYQTSQIFNGANSTEVEFGETGELTCGASLYNLYGYNLYNLIVFFKDSEMWKLSGDFPDWKRHQVSDKVGCPAPKTLKTVSLPGDIPQGLSRNVIIWQSADGVYVSDGRAPLPISADIENYFDPKKPAYIKPELIEESWADLDETKMEYHLHVASGASATIPDTELVFDLKRWKWYSIDRGTGKRLVAGTNVKDIHGNKYNYGFIDSGYMVRLENGTSFDGGDIVQTLGLGDLVFCENDFTQETRVERLELVTVAKTQTLNDLVYTHYVDTEPTGASFTLSPRATGGRRIATIVKPINSKVGIFHSGKFEMTTNNEVAGFEPLALAYSYTQQYEKAAT